MNLSQLHHLIALADTQSFSKAAARVHLTQPALSRSIQGLEAMLGAKLVDRIGRRNELTPFGLSVVERARRIAFETTELLQSASLLADGEGSSLNIGLGSGPGALLSVPLMLHMAQHFPRARLSIMRGAIALQLQALRARELDAIVVDVHSLDTGADLQIDRLPNLRAACLARSGHPLAGTGPVTIAQLRRYPLVSTALSGTAARALQERFGVQANPHVLVTLRCEEIAACLDVACASDAIFMGIVAAARDRIAAGALVEIPLTGPLGHAHLAVVTLAGRSEAPLLPMLRRFVQVQFSEDE
ncbi:MAG: LysR family transcriptional regulator [Pseudacidovorax sp.]|nr:LysR family transcriptional regulator [Pseudacidovorax sp.]